MCSDCCLRVPASHSTVLYCTALYSTVDNTHPSLSPAWITTTLPFSLRSFIPHSGDCLCITVYKDLNRVEIVFYQLLKDLQVGLFRRSENASCDQCNNQWQFQPRDTILSNLQDFTPSHSPFSSMCDSFHHACHKPFSPGVIIYREPLEQIPVHNRCLRLSQYSRSIPSSHTLWTPLSAASN